MIEFSPLIHGLQRHLATPSGRRDSVLPLAALVVGGLGFVSWGGSESVGVDGRPAGWVGVAHAGGTILYDYDSDGLSDRSERVIGSSDTRADTDFDGYPDIEEFARGSDPDDAFEIPLPASLSIAMSACGEEDSLRLQIATYFTDGDFGNKNFEIGVVIGGHSRILSGMLTQPGVKVRRGDTGAGGDVLLLDVPFPQGMVHAVGQLSVFTTLNVEGSPVIDGAAAVDLLSYDDPDGGPPVVMIVQAGPTERLNLFHGQVQGGTGGGGGGGSSGPSTGSVYNPIPPGSTGAPNTWRPSEICFQASIELSNDNGVVSHEVVAADCISGWDSRCPTNCQNTIGDTFQTFDPLGLVGG